MDSTIQCQGGDARLCRCIWFYIYPHRRGDPTLLDTKFFLPKENKTVSDYLRLLLACLMGMCINMLSFFKGLELSTPVNSGILLPLILSLSFLLSYLFR